MTQVNKIIYIMAGDQEQARQYCKYKSLQLGTTTKYIKDCSTLIDCPKGVLFVRVARWRDHPHADRINKMLIGKEGKYCD